MMAAVILVVSLAALLQFFISYCRSLIAASAKQPLSVEVQEVTGITTGARAAAVLSVFGASSVEKDESQKRQ